jgi:predicted phosphoribosyltransferase
VIAINGTYVGNGQRGEKILQPLTSFGRAVFDVVEPQRYTAVQHMFDQFSDSSRAELFEQYLKPGWPRLRATGFR